MKFLFAISLLPLSIAANASIYAKSVQGVYTDKMDEIAIFSDNIQLTTKNSRDLKQTNVNDEIKNDTTNTDSWHSAIDAIRLSAKTLYLHNFQNDIYLNNSIKLTLKKYDFYSENVLDKESDKIQHLSSILSASFPLELADIKGKATSKIGSDYKIWQSFTLGTDANINIDSIASTLQLLGTVGYRF